MYNKISQQKLRIKYLLYSFPALGRYLIIVYLSKDNYIFRKIVSSHTVHISMIISSQLHISAFLNFFVLFYGTILYLINWLAIWTYFRIPSEMSLFELILQCCVLNGESANTMYPFGPSGIRTHDIPHSSRTHTKLHHWCSIYNEYFCNTDHANCTVDVKHQHCDIIDTCIYNIYRL